MPRPPRSAADVRLFVAAYPPRGSAAAMLDALRPLTLAPHRPTPVDQLHLTLMFVGDTPAREIGAVSESVARSAAGLPALTLTPQRLTTLPSGGRPRLVALETDAPPTLMEIVRRLAARLAHHARQKPTDAYLPHLTLCRFEHTAHPTGLAIGTDVPRFTIDRIVLVRSRLTTAGAVHTPIATFPLGDR